MKLRVARHTSKLKEVRIFYMQVLKLNLIGEFIGHDGYDGIFLGSENFDWELEFTTNSIPVNTEYNEEDMLVIYPTSKVHFTSIIESIKEKQVRLFQPQNPYWKKNGICIKDPDGYHIVISSQGLTD